MEIFVRVGHSLMDSAVGGGALRLVTKEPVWNEHKGCYTMSFKGHKPIASTKNMVLIEESIPETYKLMFFKTGTDDFHL